MSDELQPDERRLADLFRQVEAPASMRRWETPGVSAVRRARWWTRAFLALFSAGGERRLRPLAAALVLPVLVLAVGGGLQLRAHFSGGSGSAVSPPARSAAAMAFDSAHGQVVLFGGRGADGQVLGDTWTWDGGSWTQQHPASSPSARSQAIMAFDAAHGVMVLYGGVPRPTLHTHYPSRETWTWDGSNWHQMTPLHSPTSAFGQIGYDAKRNQVILVDQLNFEAVATAVPQPIAGDTPLPPQAAGSAPVPALGGAVEPPTMPPTPSSARVETWTWTGSDWKKLAPHSTTSGYPNVGSLAWDDTIHRLTLITSDIGAPVCDGGEEVSTTFGSVQAVPAPTGAAHGSAGWSGYSSAPYPPSPAPSPLPTPHPAEVPQAQGGRATSLPTSTLQGELQMRQCAMMAEARALGSVNSGLHCSGCPLAHQWTWDGSNWSETKLGSTVSFGDETLVTDPTTGRPLAVDSSHTWTWSGSTWVPHLNPDGLQRRHSMSLAADTAHNVVVLFGGLAGRSAGDTWTWDGKAWTHVAGTVPPLQNSFEAPNSSGPQSVPAPACIGPQLMISDNGSGGVEIVLNRQLPSCTTTADATVTLLDDRWTPLAVRGNPIDVGTQPFVVLRWTNWCGARAGGSVQMHEANASTTSALNVFPTCTNRSQPSLLTLVPTHTVVTP